MVADKLTELTELAERCEQATGPDRLLDEAISLAIGDIFDGPGETLVNRDGSPAVIAAYTTSLDAATALVPDGWHVGMLTECDEDDFPAACLTENDEPCRDEIGKAVNMVLSLCAAALRARTQNTPE